MFNIKGSVEKLQSHEKLGKDMTCRRTEQYFESLENGIESDYVQLG